jgi:hypothetical protein
MQWHKSSYSQNGGACVEVAQTPQGAHVRDSTRPEHGHLTFPAAEWRALLAALRAGDLDR